MRLPIPARSPLAAMALATAALSAGLISSGCPADKGTGGHGHHEAGAASQPAHHGDHGGKKTGIKPVDRETVDHDGVVRRGAKLSDATALTVSDATSKAAELDGKVVKIEGTVESVCQPMGCWFVLQGKDADERIRISSKGHDIFVPKSSTGRFAVVEGELTVKTLSKEQAQHFEDEKDLKSGEERKVYTEDKKELSVAIVGLELRPSAG